MPRRRRGAKAVAFEAEDERGFAMRMLMRSPKDMVAGLLGRPLEPGALKELVVSAIIRPAEGNRWRFAHALIRDAAYSGLLASRRRELHGRYAEQLESLEPAPPIAWIARHRAAAGDRERAVPLLDKAAMTALAIGAASEAAAFWKEAADLSDDPVRADGFRLRAAEVSAAAAAAVVAAG